MKKKKYDLTSDLVTIDNEMYIIEENPKVNDTVKVNKSTNILLTMSVEESFRAEFKSWCACHRLKMNEAIVKGFQLLKEKYGP